MRKSASMAQPVLLLLELCTVLHMMYAVANNESSTVLEVCAVNLVTTDDVICLVVCSQCADVGWFDAYRSHALS